MLTYEDAMRMLDNPDLGFEPSDSQKAFIVHATERMLRERGSDWLQAHKRYLAKELKYVLESFVE